MESNKDASGEAKRAAPRLHLWRTADFRFGAKLPSVNAPKDKGEDRGSNHSSSSSSSNSHPPSSLDPEGFSETPRVPSPDYDLQLLSPEPWLQSDIRFEYDPENRIDFDTESSIHSETQIQITEKSQLFVLDESTEQDEVTPTLHQIESEIFRTATRAGTMLPSLERPSTISKMKDDLDFDISEFFDIDAAAAEEESPCESQAACPTVPDGGSSAEDSTPFDVTRDKFDPAVSFKDYLKLSEMERVATNWKPNLKKGGRGYHAEAVQKAKASSMPTAPDRLKHSAKSDVPKNPFKAGRGDCFLPSMSDSLYDEEFAAFAAAGSNLNRQFRQAEPGNATVAVKPSSSRVPGQQTTTDLAPSSRDDDDFARAGLIYIAQVLQENPGFSSTPTGVNHSYTSEEVQWAQNYLPEDAKAWMKQGCRLSGQSGAESSSQKSGGQSANPTLDDSNFWAQYDTLMTDEELEVEWDAFEEKNLQAQMSVDNLQTSVAETDKVRIWDGSLMEDDAYMLTAEENTPMEGGLSIAPIVSRLSGILLDSKGKQANRGAPQEHDGELSWDDHKNPRNKTFDEVVVADDNNRPMTVPGHDDFTTEDRNTMRSNQDSILAAGENVFQTLYGMATPVKTLRAPKVPTQSAAEISDPPSSATLGARQSVNREIFRPTMGENFPLEAPAPSTGSSTLHLSDSAGLSGSPDFECARCNKVYKKKVYLLKHEEEGNCKSRSSSALRLPVFAGISLMKLSMTDQELVDNGLPSVEARNYKHMPYCTACDKEFSNAGRLRRHIQQSCPILRDKGVYNQRVQPQLPTADQGSALALSASTTTGSFLMDEGESEVGGSRPFSKPETRNLKVVKAGSMVESPALRQSHKRSSLDGATSVVIQSAARSQKAQGSRPHRNPTPMYGRSSASMEDTIDTQDYGESMSKSSPRLPSMRDDAPDVDEISSVYADRVRLFSDELALTSPHNSDSLEPFEDLPQSSKSSHARKPGGSSTGFAGSVTRSSSSTPATVGSPPSVIFSFTNERLGAITTQRLEELIMTGVNPTIQSLRMWPSFSTRSSAAKSLFEFKVTAPGGVNLVATLRGIFPHMVIKMRGDQILFMPGDMTSPPSASEDPAAAVLKGQKPKVDKQTLEQPRRSSRTSGGPPEAESQITVKTKTEDGSQNLGEAKRRRSSSRLAELHAELDQPALAEKKRQKTNN